MHKRVIGVMLGLRPRTSCREKFKKLQILTVPSLYTLEIMTFVIKNPDKYQTNVSIHSRDMRQESVSFTISKNIFNSKWCLLFLNKDI